jgi:hypothetical protein
MMDDQTRSSLILVGILVLICWLIFYFPKLLHLERFAPFRNFPGQGLATAAMQAKISRGFNEPSDRSLPDPYSKAMMQIATQENAWSAANWSATR